jgi:Predicted membrane protein
MIKKALSHGLTILKVSTWISAIVALLVVLSVAFFVTFPSLIKSPIEHQISHLSNLNVELKKITFDFERKGLALKIHGLEVSSLEKKQPIASVNILKWRLNLMSLFEDIFQPSSIYLDTLTFYSSADPQDREFSVDDIKQLISSENLAILHFFKSLTINKTLIKGKEVIQLAPILLSRDESQLLLKISDQDIDLGGMASNLGKVDITATLSATQSEQDKFLTLPLLIRSDDFSLMSHLKLSSEGGDDFVEFISYLDQVEIGSISEYLPPNLLSSATYAWLSRAFVSGELGDVKVSIKKNLSKQIPPEIKLSAHLSDSELLFNSDWETLKHLDADISTDGKKLVVAVNKTKLNGMDLTDITVQISDLSATKLDVEVAGKINTQSEQLMQFLASAPLGTTVDEVLDQFTLEGEMEGDIKLVVPLDEREAIVDVDLTIQGNRLTTLEGSLVVENFDSKIAFHDNEIISQGVGDIRGMPFDIRINPKNRGDDDQSDFRVELINNNSGFELYIRKQLDKSWIARIESEMIKGNVIIFTEQGESPRVEVLGLQVSTLDAIKGELSISPSDIPSMRLSSKGIYVDEYQVPDLKVDLVSENNVLIINNLEFEGVGVSDKALIFNGAWLDGKTRLIAQAKGKQLSDFLDQLNIQEKVEGGDFDFDVRLFCECAPWNMSLEELMGYVVMNVKQGSFTDQDPNIGRILSLLNIKSIAKRLKLDVADVTEKGFAYDDIEVKLHIGQSLARIENFELNASSGIIRLTGESDLINEEYNLKARVSPAVGDAVPVATALAGGGLIGLGVWAIDEVVFKGKLIDKIVDKVVDLEYKITGPWDEPIIE